ncbi:MAG: hypothetical protein LC774_12475 [Acidobacteria bacterium]|nr:hypothetical protein [Acidobacteriota bacterium]
MRSLDRAERIKLIALTLFAAAIASLCLCAVGSLASDEQKSSSAPLSSNAARAALQEPKTDARVSPEGCVSCHLRIEPMHETAGGKLEKNDRDGQNLSCSYCHGGNPAATRKEDAHVRPRFPREWERDGKQTSANPERTLTLWNRESWEYVRFVNPADLRVAQKTCGECHAQEVFANETSMMRHGAMLWGAALYNNGGFPVKDARFGEAYASESGAPARLLTIPQPTLEQALAKGWLAFLDPLPRWEVSRITEPIPSTSVCKRLGSSIRRSTTSARTITPATSALRAAPPATSSTRTTAARSTRALTRASATRARARPKTRRFRKVSPATPSATG